MITPTIGRRLWYYPSPYDFSEASPDPFSGYNDQPCDAGICYVWTDRMVNVTVADANGFMHRRTSVRLLQGNEQPYPGEAHLRWMPYQVGQAKPASPEPIKSGCTD